MAGSGAPATDGPVGPGQPRTPEDATALVAYDRLARIPIILSAILPLILVPQQGHPVAIVVGVVSWLVFVVDFVVHARRLEHYLHTGFGKFDLAIVVLTAPWFLLPGASAGGAVVLLRLARLVRLMIASRGAKRLFARLGRVAVVALGVVLVGAAVAYYAEHPTNPGFANYGDSVWWAIVTLTTVGYGDIVPETATGRWAAVVIMLTGVSVLGLLAGSLANFFRLEPAPGGATGEGAPAAADDTQAPRTPPGLDDVMGELVRLQAQVALLADRLPGPSG